MVGCMIEKQGDSPAHLGPQLMYIQLNIAKTGADILHIDTNIHT